jgi:hypothetical protein
MPHSIGHCDKVMFHLERVEVIEMCLAVRGGALSGRQRGLVPANNTLHINEYGWNFCSLVSSNLGPQVLLGTFV